MNIDLIIKTARKDSRRVGGMEIRALCDEVEELRESVEMLQEALASHRQWVCELLARPNGQTLGRDAR